jgi:hypothetical protein
MGWSERLRDMTVVFASLILIFDHQRDWSAGRFSFKNPTKNFKSIVFLSLRCDF